MSQSKIAMAHEEIKRWVEPRNGKAAPLKALHRKMDPGILRIDFPGLPGEESLDSKSRHKGFANFDENHLAFLYPKKNSDGRESRLFKPVAGDS